jgi:hypothetical protein
MATTSQRGSTLQKGNFTGYKTIWAISRLLYIIDEEISDPKNPHAAYLRALATVALAPPEVKE